MIFALEFWFVDILDNIQQVKKEMENIRKALNTLGKPEAKTKYGGQCEEINSVKIRYFLMARITITILFLDRIFISGVISSTRVVFNWVS